MSRIVRCLGIVLFISLGLHVPTFAQSSGNTLHLNQEITANEVALCKTRTEALQAARVASWAGVRAGNIFLEEVCGLTPTARVLPLRVIAIVGLKDAPDKKARVLEVALFMPDGSISRRYVVVTFDIEDGSI